MQSPTTQINNDVTSDASATNPQVDETSAGNEHPPPPPSPIPPKGPPIGMIAMLVVLLVIGIAIGAWLNPSANSLVNIGSTPVSTGGGDNADAGMDNMDDNDDMSSMPGMDMSGAGVAKPKKTASSDPDDRSHDDFEFYTCGMHPWVILPDPGLCPICSMTLLPMDPEKFTGEMVIDPVVTQNIGVRIAPVTAGPVVRTIRTIGTITYDETRVRDINIKAPGWIEKLYVDYEGAEVEEGDPLFDLYSPKIYSAQSEYLTSLKMRGKVGVDFLPDSQLDSDRLILDSRTQLEYYDITDAQIDALETAGVPSKTMTIYSPIEGIVIAKHANEGMPVDMGMRPYQIADLTRVWVMVSLYEYQLPFVELGQRATMSLPYIPGQKFEGRVIYIYPYLDEATRQVNVRLEFDNPNFLLKPGMYASIDLKNTIAQKRTLAPRSAIIDTGERQIAFVSLGDGKFEPRNVLMGVETDDGMMEILDGLKPGEQVVVSGQFLLDSESRVRESLAKMIKGDMASEQKPVVAQAKVGDMVLIPGTVQTGLSSLLTNYFLIGDQLADDSIENVRAPATKIASTVDALLEIEIPHNNAFWNEHDEIATVRGEALALIDTASIEDARLAFADMSIALSKFLKSTGVPTEFDLEVQELHCPMYKGGQGGSIWLQGAGDVRNPFFGQTMLGCFDERSALPVMKDEQ
jgi:membrane fusion protein, copper/silver efflux system